MATNPDGAGAADHAADTKDFLERTADNVLGQNVFGDFRLSDLFDTARFLTFQAMRHPLALATRDLVSSVNWPSLPPARLLRFSTL
jgi:hypothetical protein